MPAQGRRGSRARERRKGQGDTTNERTLINSCQLELDHSRPQPSLTTYLPHPHPHLHLPLHITTASQSFFSTPTVCPHPDNLYVLYTPHHKKKETPRRLFFPTMVRILINDLPLRSGRIIHRSISLQFELSQTIPSMDWELTIRIPCSSFTSRLPLRSPPVNLPRSFITNPSHTNHPPLRRFDAPPQSATTPLISTLKSLSTSSDPSTSLPRSTPAKPPRALSRSNTVPSRSTMLRRTRSLTRVIPSILLSPCCPTRIGRGSWVSLDGWEYGGWMIG
jgi:hypothetical protein